MGKRKAPWWLRILKALGWLVGIGLLVVFGPALIPHRADVETIPDPRRTVPDAQNAVGALGMAMQQMLGPPVPYGTVTIVSPAAERAADEAIRTDPRRLDVADRAAALPDAQWPHQDPMEPHNAGFEAAMWVRSYGRLRAQRGQRRFDAGDTAGGLGDSFAVAELGRRLSDAGGAFTTYMYAHSIESVGLRELRTGLGVAPGLDPSRHDPTAAWPRAGWSEAQRTAWRDALHRLAGWLNEPQACQHMLAVEYHWSKDDFMPPPGTKSKSGLSSRSTLVYMPRETLRLARRVTEETMRQAALPSWQRDPKRLRIPPARGADKLFNALGRSLLSMSDQIRPLMLQTADRRRLEVAFTQICIALRLYLEDHGRLPKSLAELAPQYLKEPPLDPYDGKLVRYLPSRAMLYSVGPNGKDEGGAFGFVTGGVVIAGKGPDDRRAVIPFLIPPGAAAAAP